MLSRRSSLMLIPSAALLPKVVVAAQPREVMWEELIPSGVPYSEIIGEGEMDLVNDTWNPVYDANGTKLNGDLDGVFVKMPGFVVPLKFSGTEVSEFLLVPYTGACIHTPPPPPNQLVFVKTETPWEMPDPWEAIWVTGQMSTVLRPTDLGQSGYEIAGKTMEIYVW